MVIRSASYNHHMIILSCHIMTVIIIMIIASSSNPSLNGGRWTQLLLQTPPSFYLMKSEWPATNLLPAIPFCIYICIFCICPCILLYLYLNEDQKCLDSTNVHILKLPCTSCGKQIWANVYSDSSCSS